MAVNHQLPFAIESVGWNDLPDSDRDFFCFKEDYLPLPSPHAQQIQLLKRESAHRVWKWLGPSLPPAWPETEPHFKTEEVFLLDDCHWNSKPGVQAVRQWLHDRRIAYATDVFLVYEADSIVLMPWKLLVRYWDALAWSVGYSMIAIDPTRQWACCFHHEKFIVFGTFFDESNRHQGVDLRK